MHICSHSKGLANPNQEGRDQVVIAHHWYPPVGGELLGEGDLLAEGSALQGFESPATGRTVLSSCRGGAGELGGIPQCLQSDSWRCYGSKGALHHRSNTPTAWHGPAPRKREHLARGIQWSGLWCDGKSQEKVLV